MPGESATQTLTISNIGDTTLNYSILFEGGDLTGTWWWEDDGDCSGNSNHVDLSVEFSESGAIFLYEDSIGQWVSEYGIVDLTPGECEAVLFEYNAFFYVDTISVWYLFVENDEFTGVYTYGNGLHNGDHYGLRSDNQ